MSMSLSIRWKRIVLLLTAAGLLSGCMTTPRYAHVQGASADGGNPLFEQVQYRYASLAGRRVPDCVAVLPLAISPDAADPLSLGAGADPGQGDGAAPHPYQRRFDAEAKRRLVRRMLYGFVSTHRPRDVELGRVDRVTGGFPVTNPSRYRLVGRQLGCGWLLTGRITAFDVDYLGIYSNIRIGAELRLIHAGTGRAIWSGSHLAQSRDGAVPLSPVDLAVGAVKAAGNLSPDQLEAVAADLARRLVRTMPLEPDNPFLLAARGRQRLRVATAALNLRVGPGTRFGVQRVLRGREEVSLLAPAAPGWYRVRTRDGVEGFVARRFLRPVADTTAGTARSNGAG